MKIKNYKCKCGFDDFYFSSKGNQTGIYCIRCGKWLKWADKDERNLTLKRIDDIDDTPTIEIPKWIPVSEKEPTKGERVLMTLKNDEADKEVVIGTMSMNLDGKFSHRRLWSVIHV